MDIWKSLSILYRHDNVALKITCIKMSKLRFSKSVQVVSIVGYLHYSENLNWAAQNLRLGRMRPASCRLDRAGRPSPHIFMTVPMYHCPYVVFHLSCKSPLEACALLLI